MTNSRKIFGCVPVLHTPITSQGNVDHAGLERLLQFLLGKEIGGIWVLGTGGEDMNLTYSERLEVARTVASVVNGKIPAVIGAGFFCMKDTLNFMTELSVLNFDAIHVMPYHPVMSLDGLTKYYKTIADAAPKPLWLYTSANWCRNIPPSFIENLKGYPNIVGVKYSTSNTVHMGQVAALADDRFNVLSAVVSTFYSSLCLGVDGATSSVGSPLPEVMSEIYKLYKVGDHVAALAAQRKLNQFLSAWPKNGPSADNFLKGGEEKAILKMRGICEQHMTSYYRECSDSEFHQLGDLVKKFYPQIPI